MILRTFGILFIFQAILICSSQATDSSPSNQDPPDIVEFGLNTGEWNIKVKVLDPLQRTTLDMQNVVKAYRAEIESINMRDAGSVEFMTHHTMKDKVPFQPAKKGDVVEVLYLDPSLSESDLDF